MLVESNSNIDLNPQELMVFQSDVNVLKTVGEERGINGLEGRVKFGLDPAGMLAVPDTAKFAQSIAETEGVNVDDVWPLVAKLHKEGPWEMADKLKFSNDPAIRTYLVLAGACREVAYPGYNPQEYINDRKRVVNELSSYKPDQFESRKQVLEDGVSIDKVMAGGRVPVAEGDVALPLAVRGYHGCVSKNGDMRFASASVIGDALLEKEGLVKAYAEVYNPEKDDFDRIPFSDPNSSKGRAVWVLSSEVGKDVNDMKPAAKRIAVGYVLTYGNEDLAVKLVDESIAK